MSLIMMTCSLCNKNMAWDSKDFKQMPTHLCETTGGQKLCNGNFQWIPKPYIITQEVPNDPERVCG